MVPPAHGVLPEKSLSCRRLRDGLPVWIVKMPGPKLSGWEMFTACEAAPASADLAAAWPGEIPAGTCRVDQSRRNVQ